MPTGIKYKSSLYIASNTKPGIVVLMENKQIYILYDLHIYIYIYDLKNEDYVNYWILKGCSNQLFFLEYFLILYN